MATVNWSVGHGHHRPGGDYPVGLHRPPASCCRPANETERLNREGVAVPEPQLLITWRPCQNLTSPLSPVTVPQKYPPPLGNDGLEHWNDACQHEVNGNSFTLGLAMGYAVGDS